MHQELILDNTLLLAKISIERAQDLFELVDLNRAHIRKWGGWVDATKTVSDTKTFIKSQLKGMRKDSILNYLIFDNGTLCGTISFNEINKQHHFASIGYWLAESHTGKGIITKATQALLKIGFKDYELNKIEIRCATGNRKSRAIPERLGFKHEARLRKCEWLYDHYVDHEVYSILATEYKTPGSS